MMKWILRTVIVLAILAVLAVVINWSTFQRLRAVETVFDADKIVENFSHMDRMFLHQYLEIGDTPHVWPEDIQPLPTTVTVAGRERNLAELLETLQTTALVIIRGGTLIHESYYHGTDRDDLRISWSVAKSFVSGLYGPVLESGAIGNLNDTVEIYVPEMTGTAYEGVTLRNLLNMASGVRFSEDYMDPESDIIKIGRILGLGQSLDKFATSIEGREHEPGVVWKYVSMDTHVAAMALRRATGKSLHQLFYETYGSNLGFGRAPYYLTDGKNVALALGGLNLRTRDYAKFGQLFLQNGQWRGEQIIPSNWVAESTQHTAPTMAESDMGYGYQWWVPMPQEGIHRGDVFAVGMYGQYVYVNPRLGIVIAKNATHHKFAEPIEGFDHSRNLTIEMFRSLSGQLANMDQ
ncbi:MAG: serine hydrolase [Hyphomonadaceae bacterium]|nr:serine hydrolase [Hyphomonadaceae bacterium]MBC6412771.1 serine hydrolase [Hyphomonadaceae bacterium]